MSVRKEKIKSFKHFLEEQAFLRNKNLSDLLPAGIIDTDLRKYNFEILKTSTFEGFKFFELESGGSLFFVCTDDDLNIKLYLKAKIFKIIGKKIILEANTVEKSKTINNKGMGLRLYEYVLNKGFGLISDKQNTEAGMKLWLNLSKKYKVNIINIETLEILEQDIKLKPEDSRVWTRDLSKSEMGNIRLVII